MRQPELAAFVLEVEPLEKLPVRCFLGRALHAWVLELISLSSPEKAVRLHDEEGLKPFTVTSLQVWGGKRFVRVTALEPSLVRELSVLFSRLRGEVVRWDGISFRVVRVICEGHPWAGRSDYPTLSGPWLKSPPGRPPRKLALRFYSPTSFHTRGATLPLPLPGLVFGNLLERWNRWAPMTLSPELKRFADSSLVISKYNLKSVALPLVGGVQIGFVGLVEYTALEGDPYWLSLVQLLADFAFYAGVGVKTGMGFGTCKRAGDGGTLSYRAGGRPS